MHALVILSVLVTASAASRRTEAQEETPSSAAAIENFWEIAANAGYLTPPIRGGTTPFGAGLGGRIGGSVGNLYIGGKVAGYLGGSDIDVTDRSVLFGAEVGYSFHIHWVGPFSLVVRPQIGVGGLVVFHTDPSSISSTAGTASTTPDVVTTASGKTTSGGGGSGPSDTTTVSAFYLEPSLPLLFSAGGSVFFGVRPSMLIVPRVAYSGADPATWLCYGIHVELGTRF